MKRKSGLMRFLSLMLAMGTVLASVLPSAGQRVLAVGASSSAAERLVAHYKFDGDFNDTSSDSTGTAEGGTAPTLTSDSIRGQVMKSGSGKSWIRTDNPLHGKETLDGFTVGAWVKANAVDTWNGIWSISSGAGGSGSHGIVVWESDDLVNWSEPWIAEIAPENAGCTWAPEFIYDAMTGEYVVYWSATTIELNENEEITQEYENHAIYYAKTRDFRTFTEPVLYHAGGEDSSGKRIKVIDSTMIEDDGKYYRYTKNESCGVIEIDVADSVLGTFTPIASTALSTTLPSQQGAVEDPIIFKLNEKSADGKTQWCLMVDRFARGQGYYPLITTDLASGDFTLLDNDDFYMPSKYRHGYVMPVTAAEYDALQRAYGSNAAVEEPVAVTGVTLNTNTVTLTVGQSTLLIATVAPEDATNRNVRWTSSDSTIAAVDSDGNVKAVAAGEAIITVTTEDGSKTATCTITVTKQPGGGTHVDPVEPSKPVEEQPEASYSDVKPTDWYAEAVEYVSEQGLMTGVGNGKFSPDTSVTRAMVWTVLARMAGENTDGGATWYAKAQAWAMETGVSDGTNPTGSITREQLAAMLYRFEGSPAVSGNLNAYPDANEVSDWAVDAMVWATQQGMINGIGGSLSPKTGATRAQLATMLMRFCQR